MATVLSSRSSPQHGAGSAHRWMRLLPALAGIVAPALFVLIVATLFVLEYPFLVRNGADPTLSSYPSATALGPFGWLQTANFLLSGALVILFATGLHRGVTAGHGARIGPIALALVGVALLLCGVCSVDLPITTSGPKTVHGLIHDLAYLAMAVLAPLASLVLWRRLRRDPRWRGYDRLALVNGITLIVLFLAGFVVIPGPSHLSAVVSDLWFIVVFGWIAVLALRLWALVRPRAAEGAA